MKFKNNLTNHIVFEAQLGQCFGLPTTYAIYLLHNNKRFCLTGGTSLEVCISDLELILEENENIKKLYEKEILIAIEKIKRLIK